MERHSAVSLETTVEHFGAAELEVCKWWQKTGRINKEIDGMNIYSYRYTGDMIVMKNVKAM